MILDFVRKRVEKFAPGVEEGEQKLNAAVDAQMKLQPTTSGVAPPQKSV